MKKDDKTPIKPEKVKEVFNVKKKGEKEKTVEAEGVVEEKIANPKQVSNQNKLLRNILIALGLLILAFLIGYFLVNSFKTFEYKGITFNVVKEAKPAPYTTMLPATYQGKKINYYFYLRNDPRKLENKVSFEGELNIKENLGIAPAPENLFCEGYWSVGVNNMLNLYKLMGTNIYTGENITCDDQGRYMYIEIVEAEETNVEQIGPSCYRINVADCEIVAATERFMIETLEIVNAEFI